MEPSRSWSPTRKVKRMDLFSRINPVNWRVGQAAATHTYRKRRKLPKAVAATSALVLAFSVAACDSSSSSSDSTSSGTAKVTLSVSPVAETTITDIGIDQGYFKGEGLHAATKVQGASAQTVPLLVNGQINVMTGNLATFIAALSSDLPLQMLPIGTLNSADPKQQTSALVTAPGSAIDSLEQLNGKTIGIISPGSTLDMETRAMLMDGGANPKTVRFTALPLASLWTSVQSHQVDAAVVQAPYLSKALEAGAKVLGYPDSALPGVASTVLLINRDFAKDHPEVVDKIVAGYKKSVAYANANPDAVREATAKQNGAKANPSQQVPIFTSTLTDVQPLNVMANLLVKYGFIKSAPDLTDAIYHS